MLQLLISVTLDSLEQSRQCQLLLSSETCFLLFNELLDDLLLTVLLSLLLKIALIVQLFGFLVALRMEQFLHLLTHVHQLLGESDLD